MVLLAMEDDIEAIVQAAKHMRAKYRKGLLNPLSSLPEPKEKLRAAIKERIRLLAGAYVSLASFIDDDDLLFAEEYPKSKRARRLYKKVLRDIQTAQQEMRRFKII